MEERRGKRLYLGYRSEPPLTERATCPPTQAWGRKGPNGLQRHLAAPQGGSRGGWPSVGAFVFPDCVSVSAVTGCLFCGVRGVGVGAWPVAGQVREAGHEQPHLPVLLLPGTTSYCGCPPSASSLPWAWPGRGANDLAGTSPHLDPLGQGRLTWAQAWVPDRWVLCSPLPHSSPGRWRRRGGVAAAREGARGRARAPFLSQTVDAYSRAEGGAEGMGNFSVSGQEMISMQIRCKLLNEFAIRNGGCQVRAAPAGFMNGPAWGGGRGRRAGPPPRFPAAEPATCRAARCCLPAPPRPGPPPAGQLLRTERGRLPARVLAAPPEAKRRATARPLGPGRGLPSVVPFLGDWNGFLKLEGVK